MSTDSKFEIVIEPSRRWLSVPWRELVEYRDLFFLLVRREFVVKYKQTALGPLWAVIQSLMMATVFVVVFTRVAKVSTDGVPPMLFYLSGILVWTYFAQTLNTVSLSLRTNSNLFSKVYFPRLIVPLAAACSNLIPLTIQFLVFLGFYVFYSYTGMMPEHLRPTAALFALPLFVLQAGALGLGAGLVAAALTVRYRDLSHLIPFVLQIGIYATPVVYPLSVVSDRWRPLVTLNPLAPLIESCRHAFFGTAAVPWFELAASFAVTAVLLLVGLILFSRVERTFVDTV
jgi:lipopolysaccharide transport system permease protein